MDATRKMGDCIEVAQWIMMPMYTVWWIQPVRRPTSFLYAIHPIKS